MFSFAAAYFTWLAAARLSVWLAAGVPADADTQIKVNSTHPPERGAARVAKIFEWADDTLMRNGDNPVFEQQLCAMDTNKLLGVLPDLLVLVKVVESGSFSAAGRALGCTPSAVSRQMARLEQALGSRLLERTTRSLAADRGRSAGVSAQARPCWNRPRRCWIARARIRPSPAAGCGWPCPGIWPAGDPPADAGILARYPKVDVQLLLDDHARDPISDEVDLVVLATDRPPPGLVAR